MLGGVVRFRGGKQGSGLSPYQQAQQEQNNGTPSVPASPSLHAWPILPRRARYHSPTPGRTSCTAGMLPKAESDEFFARYAELAAVYPLDGGEMVSSHNGVFKPGSISCSRSPTCSTPWEPRNPVHAISNFIFPYSASSYVK